MPVQQVEDLLAALRMGSERFLYGLEQVPDDRLAWAPVTHGKTPLKVAARLARHLRMIAHGLRERGLPADRSVFDAATPEDREAARAGVDEALRELVAALSALTEADLEQEMQAPWGARMPIRRYLPFVMTALAYFQGQLNYVQLAYGDENPNIPPRWREPS